MVEFESKTWKNDLDEMGFDDIVKSMLYGALMAFFSVDVESKNIILGLFEHVKQEIGETILIDGIEHKLTYKKHIMSIEKIP